MLSVVPIYIPTIANISYSSLPPICQRVHRLPQKLNWSISTTSNNSLPMHFVLFKCMHINIPVQKESIHSIHAIPTTPVSIKDTTWKLGNQVTGLDKISDWHNYCIWNVIPSSSQNRTFWHCCQMHEVAWTSAHRWVGVGKGQGEVVAWIWLRLLLCAVLPLHIIEFFESCPADDWLALKPPHPTSLFIDPHQNGVIPCWLRRLVRAIGMFWMGAYPRSLVVVR